MCHAMASSDHSNAWRPIIVRATYLETPWTYFCCPMDNRKQTKRDRDWPESAARAGFVAGRDLVITD